MVKSDKKVAENKIGIVDDPAMKDLLDKTRQVGRALQSRREGTKPDYSKLAKLLCEFSTANVYIINREGRILGHSWVSEYHSEAVANFLERGYMPESFVEKMNQHRESILSETDGYLFDDEVASKEAPEKHLLYVPIYSAAERRGHCFRKVLQPLHMKDLIWQNILPILVGIEILHDRTRSIEERARERLVVQMAMRVGPTIESVKHIIAGLELMKESSLCQRRIVWSYVVSLKMP